VTGGVIGWGGSSCGPRAPLGSGSRSGGGGVRRGVRAGGGCAARGRAAAGAGARGDRRAPVAARWWWGGCDCTSTTCPAGTDGRAPPRWRFRWLYEVGGWRVAANGTFPQTPSRTVRARFRAHGSPEHASTGDCIAEPQYVVRGPPLFLTPFALWPAFPASLGGRDSTDYYGVSVTIGRVSRKSSRSTVVGDVEHG
jgi:hypothetical protein